MRATTCRNLNFYSHLAVKNMPRLKLAAFLSRMKNTVKKLLLMWKPKMYENSRKFYSLQGQRLLKLRILHLFGSKNILRRELIFELMRINLLIFIWEWKYGKTGVFVVKVLDEMLILMRMKTALFKTLLW